MGQGGVKNTSTGRGTVNNDSIVHFIDVRLHRKFISRGIPSFMARGRGVASHRSTFNAFVTCNNSPSKRVNAYLKYLRVPRHSRRPIARGGASVES